MQSSPHTHLSLPTAHFLARLHQPSTTSTPRNPGTFLSRLCSDCSLLTRSLTCSVALQSFIRRLSTMSSTFITSFPRSAVAAAQRTLDPSLLPLWHPLRWWNGARYYYSTHYFRQLRQRGHSITDPMAQLATLALYCLSVSLNPCSPPSDFAVRYAARRHTESGRRHGRVRCHSTHSAATSERRETDALQSANLPQHTLHNTPHTQRDNT